jgi:hypothetical protein
VSADEPGIPSILRNNEFVLSASAERISEKSGVFDETTFPMLEYKPMINPAAMIVPDNAETIANRPRGIFYNLVMKSISTFVSMEITYKGGLHGSASTV